MNKTAFLIIALILMLPIKIVAQTYTLTFDYDSNGNRVLRELVFEEIREKPFPELEEKPNGVFDNALDALDVKLFPNPTYGKFSVEISGEMPVVLMKAVLVTSTGGVVSEKTFTGDRLEFDLSCQASGMYLLQLSTAEGMRVWRIIKK